MTVDDIARRRQLLCVFGVFLLVAFAYQAAFFNLFSLAKSNSSTKKPTTSSNISAYFNALSTKFHNGGGSGSGGHVNRVVFMLIDALRYDFVLDADGQGRVDRMPFVARLLRERRAHAFRLNALPPTVTLPRVKALVAGIRPEFVDMLWNMGKSTALVEDNLLRRLRAHNHSVVFYGDDTWLRLFEPPGEHFLRYEGTTSFLASDYFEACVLQQKCLAFHH